MVEKQFLDDQFRREVNAKTAARRYIKWCGNVGGFVGPYITGFIKETTGSFIGAWIYLACSLVLAGLLMLTFKKRLPV